jgi:hypothetical protein
MYWLLLQAIRDKGLNTKLGLPYSHLKKRGHFPRKDHEKEDIIVKGEYINSHNFIK